MAKKPSGQGRGGHRGRPGGRPAGGRPTGKPVRRFTEDESADLGADHDFGVPIPGTILPGDQWAKTALKKLPPHGELSIEELFGRVAPLVLDLGCGNGRFLLSSALARPEMNHLGIDILPMVIRYATRRANQRGLHNARLAVIGAYELLEQYIQPHTVQEIHLYHPQPYKDLDKSFKRLVTPEFLSLVYRSLVPGGLFVIQTDNRAYWEYIVKVMPRLFTFEESNSPWPDAVAGRTRREIYARCKGMRIFRGSGIPLPDLSSEYIAKVVAETPPPRFFTR